MDNWYRVIIKAPGILEEIISEILRSKGSEGIESRLDGDKDILEIISYHHACPSAESIEQSIHSTLAEDYAEELKSLELRVEKFEPVDWVSKQADSMGNTKIKDGLWIVPPWNMDNEIDGEKIIIEPGSAFGTGEHPTTRQCLVAIYKYFKKGQSFLDVGAGSGILSVAAYKLGAGRIAGIEIDENAERNALANFEFNGCEGKIDWHTGSIHTYPLKEKFDFVAANILSQTIIMDAAKIKEAAAPGATFVFSGILVERGTDLLEKIRKHGFTLVEAFPEGEWQTFVMEIKE